MAEGSVGLDIVCSAVSLGLATFLLVLMLKDLDGPYDIFNIIRSFIFMRHHHKVSEYKFEVVDNHPRLADLWSCAWCLSTWVSIPLVVLWSIFVIRLSWASDIFLWLISTAISGLIYHHFMEVKDGQSE